MNLALLPSLADIEIECCSRSLAEFTRRTWHIVEPGRPYVHGWHIDAICEHLEAVYRRQIRNLIINIQPRCMKSLLTGVFWPTWVWGPMGNPESRWLTASYAEKLAVRDAVKARNIIQSAWYQRRWGRVFQLSGDQNVKQRYENNCTGYRISVGIAGGATGEGGDFLLFDDPHKLSEDGESANIENATDWVSSTMTTRGNDPDTFVRVIIMQRVAQDDVTGYVLKQARESGENWEVLSLPTEYEPTPYISTIGWKDPRTKPAELLWPERFNRQRVNIMKAELGHRAPAQLQQRPQNPGGNIFLRAWWQDQNRYNVHDPECRGRVTSRYLSLDTALSEKVTAAFTAVTTGELTKDYRLQIRAADRRHLTYPQLVGYVAEKIKAANADNKLKGIIVEYKSSGISLVQTLLDQLPPELARLVFAYTPDSSKPIRWQTASVWCSNGSILMPYPDASLDWLFDFEEELYKVPGSDYKDYADSFSQLVDYLRNYLALGLRARMS